MYISVQYGKCRDKENKLSNVCLETQNVLNNYLFKLVHQNNIKKLSFVAALNS